MEWGRGDEIRATVSGVRGALYVQSNEVTPCVCRSCSTRVKISGFYESSTYVQECGYGLLHVPYMSADACPGYGPVGTLFGLALCCMGGLAMCCAAYEESQC